MLMDYNAQFSDAQSMVKTATGTTASTNVLDTEAADSNLGSGTPIWVVCRVSTAITCNGMSVNFEDCATSGGTYVTRLVSEAYSIGAVDAVGDDLLVIPLPSEHQRYIRLLYNQLGTIGAGAVDAYLCLNDPHALKTK